MDGTAPVLALDLGASRIRAAVVAADGSLASRSAGPTPSGSGPAAVLEACLVHLRAARDAAPRGLQARLGGVGISAPGPLQAATGMLIEPPNLGPGFRDMPFAEPIGEAMRLAARLERDTNVAALAEWEFGAARGSTDFIYFTVSTGIGGAIVAGGQLLTGPDGVAGELGHLAVALDGPICGCGAQGHLEAFSSGVAIARAVAEKVAAGTAGGLAARAAAMGRPLSARDVAKAEEAGDSDAGAIMDLARTAFAATCVGLVNALNPELIVIGGSLARNQGDRWLHPARDAVARDAFRIPRERVRIVPAGLGDDVGLVGALPLLRARLTRRDDPET